MVRPRRVLVVDDAEEWSTELVETLRREGYHAESASTAEQTLEQLDTSLYHVVVLDIRLEDNNPKNIDGIKLLQELKRRNISETIKVIMLSYYDTKEHMRTSFRDYGVVDFLSKGEFNKKIFLDSIDRAFSEKVNINLSLDTFWQDANGPEEAVLNLSINETSVDQGTPLQHLIAFELDDLLCRLFHEAKSILVRPVTPGQSATGVLEVQPFYPHTGSREIVIAKFGSTSKIGREQTNFKKYVEHTLGGGRSTVVYGLRQTPHLDGIIYSFVGVANTRLKELGDFYRAADLPRLKKGLEQLFLVTCGNWYANRSQLQPYDLTEDYRRLLNLTSEKLEQGLLALRTSVQGADELHFPSLSEKRIFTNPLLAAANRSLRYTTYICTMHGDFNQHNILLDDNDNTWLIDFLRTGQGHILRDISELDSVVRFELLTEQEATLDERLKMEEALCSIERFSQIKQLDNRLPTENSAVAKAYATVVHLRKLAGNLLRRGTHHSMDEYYAALLYHALNTLRFYDLSVTQREHALLCASLLADKLRLKG